MSSQDGPSVGRGRIEIADWSPEWAGKFELKGAIIREALGPSALRIDHIGSTSIMRMSAKPIIDIQVSVAEFEDATLAEAMARAGYLWRVSNPELTKRYFREQPGTERTHVHVRLLGSWHEQWALLFRDYMRAQPEEHAAYASLKRDLAARFPFDRTAYTDAKGDHLWSVIRRADLWAGEVGWRPGPSGA